MNRSLPFSPRYTRQRVHGVRLSACQSPPVISLRLPLGTSALMDAVWMRGGKHFSVPSEGNQTVILELIRLTLGSDLNPHRAKVPQGSKAHALVLHIERRRDGPRKEGRFWVANLAFDRIDRDGGSRANRGGGHAHGGALTPRGLARSRRGGDAKAIDGA